MILMQEGEVPRRIAPCACGGRYLYDGAEITGVVVAPTGTTLNNRIIRGPWPDEVLVAYQGNTASTPLWSLQDHQG